MTRRPRVSERMARAHAALADALIDTSNRLIWPGLSAATKDASAHLAQLNAIAEAREADAREGVHV